MKKYIKCTSLVILSCIAVTSAVTMPLVISSQTNYTNTQLKENERIEQIKWYENISLRTILTTTVLL